MDNFHFVQFSEIFRVGRLDAEYWNKNQSAVSNDGFASLRSVCKFIRTGPMGSTIPSSIYQEQGLPIVRPSNLNQLVINDVHMVWVSERFINERRLQRYKQEDILLARVGDFKFGMVYGFSQAVTISSNMIAVRVNELVLNPYYLLTFLSTEMAKGQLVRSSKRVSIQTFGITAIGDLRVPLLNKDDQDRIGKLMQEALVAWMEAKQWLSAVQDIFAGREKKVKMTVPPISWQIPSLSVHGEQRLDAEYFLDVETITHCTIQTVPFGSIAEFKRGIEVGRKHYWERGISFWRVGNISRLGLLSKGQQYIARDLYEKLRGKYQPEAGELLLVKDGKPGVCMVLGEAQSGIVSEGIVRVKIEKLDPYYVAACINSEFCERQIRKHMDGSLVPHWKMEQIEKLRIPILPDDEQKKIGNLMRGVYEREMKKEYLKKEAVSMLEQICES